jgi:hypothetical protein
MAITNCPMHNNDSTQCVGLVSTNCLHHLKIQNGHWRRSKFALKPYGKQHFHLLLENSRTEFNQTWQRCFLWGPKKLSWFVLTRPTYWVLSLLCIGQFVMPIILTWVLFCSKCAELLSIQSLQQFLRRSFLKIDQSEFSKSHGGHVFWRICTKVATLV